jgi:hypothetical protein
LSIAGVAAWYSIVGLMAIFSGAAIPIAIMGGVLEVGKLVTAAWLHANWKKVPLLMKTYLTTAVFMLMVITSLGIFGFLSKAHLEHSISIGGNNALQISNLERQIARQQSIITDAETVLAQLDQQVSVLIEYDRIRGPTGSIAVRESQYEERSLLNETIDAAYIRIDKIQEDLSPLQQESLAIEVEVGPLKYIAELIYGEDDARNHFDRAVRFVIILLVSVFDPLAVVLLLAATMGFTARKQSRMFTDDGELKVGRENVVDVEELLPVEPVINPPSAVDDAANVMSRWEETSKGKYDVRDTTNISNTSNANSDDGATIVGSTNDEDCGENAPEGRSSTDNSLHLRQVGETRELSSIQQDNRFSNIDEWEEIEDLPPDDEIEEVLEPDAGHGIEDTDSLRNNWVNTQRNKRKKT